MLRFEKRILLVASALLLVSCADSHGPDEHRGEEHGHEHDTEEQAPAAHEPDDHDHDNDDHDEEDEGKTRIATDVAAAAGIKTELAGAGQIVETISAYGTLVSPPGATSDIAARFAGVVKSVRVSVGDGVREGDVLAYVEADDSLTSYAIRSPISGVVARRIANSGESTADRVLFSVIDPTRLWAELAIFASDIPRVRIGAPARIAASFGNARVSGEIAQVSPVAEANQSIIVRVPVDNSDLSLTVGMKVSAEIVVGRHAVPVVVKRSGVQTVEDRPVVYVQQGDQYEVHALELGRSDDEWAEVLTGIEPGARYVTTNSYVVKADIEKSGAEHDH